MRALQLVDHHRGAAGAVAFPAEIFGAVPAAIIIDPAANDLLHLTAILPEAVSPVPYALLNLPNNLRVQMS